MAIKTRQTLLVVDDEPNIRYSLRALLASPSLEVIEASTAKDGIEAMANAHPSAVLLDVRLPDMSGLDAFDRMHQIDEKTPIIMMTAFTKTETAIEAMRRGAFEYFVKPVDFDVLSKAVERALEISRLSHVPALVDQDATRDNDDFDRIVGNSQAMQEVYKSIGRVASQDVTVLILGESGTGKELVARSIFHYSKRNNKPFLAVNCAALSESLLESELFGHEKGAFTGAEQRRIGKFEQVNGGTIFLDEVGDMSPSTQAKALRLLQQQEFERVGGTTTIHTDVRVIAATNRNLWNMVSQGTFREDLLYRLNGYTIQIPSLRDRKEDIPQLIDHFLQVTGQELGKSIVGMSDDARQALLAYDWPGNIRELLGAIRYAVVQSTGGIVTMNCLPSSVRGSEGEYPPVAEAQLDAGLKNLVRDLLAQGRNDIYREILRKIDTTVIEEVLRICDGNQVAASERLGISRPTLRTKIRSKLDN